MIFALHGFTGSGFDFQHLNQEFSQPRIDMAPDLPGHGTRGGDRHIDLDSTLDWLRHEHDRNSKPPSILLGYSMGGRIALNWVLQDHDRFQALVLISTSSGLEASARRQERNLADAAWIQRLHGLKRSAWLDSWNKQAVFQTPRPMNPAIQDTIRQHQLQADPEGWAAAMKGLGTGVLPYLGNDLDQIKVPTLLITGEYDTKFHSIAIAMKKALPQAQHCIISDAGHRPHLEQAKVTAATISQFAEEFDLG